MKCEKCGSISGNSTRCVKCGASLVVKTAAISKSATHGDSMTTLDGVTRKMSVISQDAVITRVEKWESLNAEITTSISGGGGYLHQGTGHIQGVNSTATTTINSHRNVRLYYQMADGVERNLTYAGGDLDITEGSPVVIEWFQLEGFQELLAGLFNVKNQKWYQFNSTEYFISGWIGLKSDASVMPSLLLLGLSVAGFITICLIANMLGVKHNSSGGSITVLLLLISLGTGALSLFMLFHWCLLRIRGKPDRMVAEERYRAAYDCIQRIASAGTIKKHLGA